VHLLATAEFNIGSKRPRVEYDTRYITVSGYTLLQQTISNLQLRFDGRFLGEHGLAFLFHLCWKIIFGVSGTGVLRAGCPSCHPSSNNVKTLKKTQSNDPDQGNQPLTSSFLDSPLDT